jgi:hypothetical protein
MLNLQNQQCYSEIANPKLKSVEKEQGMDNVVFLYSLA